MDILFSQILYEIDKFIALAKKVPGEQSEHVIKPRNLNLNQWKVMILEARRTQKKLHTLINNNPRINLFEVSEHLDFFRELPRYLARIPYKESSYYNKINKILDEQNKLLINIDTKYRLDQTVNDP